MKIDRDWKLSENADYVRNVKPHMAPDKKAVPVMHHKKPKVLGWTIQPKGGEIAWQRTYSTP